LGRKYPIFPLFPSETPRRLAGRSSRGIDFCFRAPLDCCLVESSSRDAKMPDHLARDLQTKAQSALTESGVVALRDLQVEHVGDGLLLRGVVSSFYHKQLAQEMVRVVIGDVALVNDIDVR